MTLIWLKSNGDCQKSARKSMELVISIGVQGLGKTIFDAVNASVANGRLGEISNRAC